MAIISGSDVVVVIVVVVDALCAGHPVYRLVAAADGTKYFVRREDSHVMHYADLYMGHMEYTMKLEQSGHQTASVLRTSSFNLRTGGCWCFCVSSVDVFTIAGLRSRNGKVSSWVQCRSSISVQLAVRM